MIAGAVNLNSFRRTPLGAQAAGDGPWMPRLIAGHFVGPYRMQGKRGKNDANDAAAVCEAAGRPHMRFVPIKTRAAGGAGRAPLARGVQGRPHRVHQPHPRSAGRVRAGVPAEPQALRTGNWPTPSRTPTTNCRCGARGAAARATAVAGTRRHIAWCDERIAAHVQATSRPRRLALLMGIGPGHRLGAGGQRGRLQAVQDRAKFGAWLGLVPSQNSSGGKASLGRITKRGDDYLRTLLIQGAKSAVMTAHKRETGSRSGWCN
jgi:transposase